MKVRAAGDGEHTVVLLHGFADGARTWRRVMPALAETYRVLAPDLPGLSGTGRADFRPLLPGYVEMVAAMLDEQDARGPVSLVGNSMGAVVALMFALEYPERTARLVLVDMARVGPRQPIVTRAVASPLTGGLLPLAGAVPPSWVTWGIRTAYGQATAGPTTDRRTSTAVQRADKAPSRARMVSLMKIGRDVTQELVEAGLADRLGDVRAPTLVVWGRRDPIVPVRYAGTLANRIPQARLAVIDGGSHRPQMETPAEFLAAVGTFLADV